MHRALQISEICREICAALKESPSQKWRRDLVALAITARAVSEPALDVLWEELDWIGYLFLLLPCVECCGRVNRPRKHGALLLQMTRSIFPEDWQRFDLYARRVRILQYSDDDELHSNKFVLDAVLSSRPENMFPSLQELGWRNGRSLTKSMGILTGIHIQRDLLPLLYPGLKHLELSFSTFELDSLLTGVTTLYKSPTLEALLRKVSEVAPSLESFACYAHPLQLTSMDFMEKFTNLRSFVFTACPLHLNAMRHLSSLNTLTRISLNASTSAPSDIAYLPSGFHALEILHVMHGHIDFGEVLLDRISSTRIYEFSWRSSIVGGAPGAAFFEKLTRFPLSVLHVGISPLGEYQTLDFQDVRPLFSVRSLMDVRLHDISLSDHDLLALSSAWPKLRFLAISGHEKRSLSFSSIAFLSQSCPDLYMVQLQSYFIPSIPRIYDIPILSNNLKYLCIDNAVLLSDHDWSVLTRACQRIFPHLKSFNSRSVREALLLSQSMVSWPTWGYV